MPALARVLDAIARAVLSCGTHDAAPQLGAVTLRPHQHDALHRLRASIAEFGGVLLADEPGLGKTFVALALAREYPEALIVAPAALRRMWAGAMDTTGVHARFMSFESLSRCDARTSAPRRGLVIVDEAHHACNPRAARYGRLARLTAASRVLLLSATPVRNRRAELTALLALFMGPRAGALSDAARSRCIVRRAAGAALLPKVDGPHWHRLRALSGVREMIARLPPPLPATDGAEARALLTVTLARCWASSLAALDVSLKRREQRGAALGAILAEGRLPTRRELRSWVIGDDAVQLAFPLLVARHVPDTTRMRAVLDAHMTAVRDIRKRIAARVDADAATRGRWLLRLRGVSTRARVLAFTSHAATAEAVYRAIAHTAGVALLTARGARTAGGARPRADVIRALAGEPARRPARQPARDDISLVITTDLLSEGVNLQGATHIVHLDVPWTPAALSQRVGRAVRMGSAHARVQVHGIAPPAAAEQLLALGRRLSRKRGEQAEAARAADEFENLREVVRPWLLDDCPPGPLGAGMATAHIRAGRDGALAVVEREGAHAVVCGARRNGPRGGWSFSDSPGDLLAAARAVRHSAAKAEHAFAGRAAVALRIWLESREASEQGGGTGTPSRARRELAAKLDAALWQAGAHARAAAAPRMARVRAAIDGATGAGWERTLAELVSVAAPDLRALLEACEAALPVAHDTPEVRGTQAGPHAGPGVADGIAGRAVPTPSLRALLLLRRAP